MRDSPRWIGILCIALFATSFLPGCSNSPSGPLRLTTGALQDSDARLKIFRESVTLGLLVDVRVKVDGREVAAVGAGASTLLDVPAGTHRISVHQWGHPNEYTITLDAKPGMLYALEITPRTEAVVAGMFGLVGMLAEAAANENGGSYKIDVVDARPLRT